MEKKRKLPHYKLHAIIEFLILKNETSQFGPCYMAAWKGLEFFSNNNQHFKGKQVFLIILIVKFKWKKEKEKDIYLTTVYILGQ